MESVVEQYGKQCVFAAAVLVVLAGRASAQDRLVQEATDPATGSVVRVYRTEHGPRIDLQAPALEVRKEVVNGRVKTTITGAGESLVIEAGSNFVSVVGSRGEAVATAEDPAPLAKARRLVAQSPIAARAAALIAKLGFGENSPLQPLLLTTRAFLLAAQDDESGSRELSEWMRKARNRAQVIKVSAGQKTPTDCWKAYGDELVEAFTDYVDCVNNLHWYNIFGERGCAVIYEVRIIGAFAWWMDCVKLVEQGD